MLKTVQDNTLWLVGQNDHSQLAGYFASHWGNKVFARPGHYATPTPVADPERLRAEAVFAIAEHDNGWWEWEATPALSADDGFPAGLVEALKNQPASMERLRRGSQRFPDHPLVCLLISSHAYLFYAARALAQPDPSFIHPMFWKGAPEKLGPGSVEGPLAFMAELDVLRRGWIDQLRSDPATVAWVEPATLAPLQRLTQLCDGLSQWLCSALIPPVSGAARGIGEDAFELHHVPRGAWGDRCTISVTPLGGRRVRFDPFPFDIDPLPVLLPARTVQLPAERPVNFQTYWHAGQPRLFEFCFVSGK